MTKLEVIVRLAEIKGSLLSIRLQEISDVKRELIRLIDDIAKSFIMENRECVHQWRIIPDKTNPSGTTMFCKLCGERDE
jgi:hypothetical protein